MIDPLNLPHAHCGIHLGKRASIVCFSLALGIGAVLIATATRLEKSKSAAAETETILELAEGRAQPSG